MAEGLVPCDRSRAIRARNQAQGRSIAARNFDDGFQTNEALVHRPNVFGETVHSSD